MPLQFLSLPGEIRNHIYRHALVYDGVIDIRHRKTLQGSITAALLRANREIHREALPFLYTENRFALLALNRASAAEVNHFLDGIGLKNASYMRHIQICHPIFRNLGDDAKLDENCVRLLSRLQGECPNLRTLSMSAESTDFVVRLQLAPLVPVNPNYITGSLASFDERLKAIDCLEEIIVQVYRDTPLLTFLRSMEQRGWRIDVLDADSRYSDEELTDKAFGKMSPSPLGRC